jgi:hypothetical protein
MFFHKLWYNYMIDFCNVLIWISLTRLKALSSNVCTSALQAEVAELKARVIRLRGQTPNETSLSDTDVRVCSWVDPKSSPVLGVDPSSYPNLTDACDNLTAKLWIFGIKD